MKSERIDYQAVIESLADGVEIDWGALDTRAASDLERRRYRNLRLVARVAELHRTLVADGPAGPAAGEGEALSASPAVPFQWGHLAVRARIAGGSYGEVFLARDPQLNRDVALKLLRQAPSATQPLDRLLAEARSLAAVRHPNVVAVYGADVRDGRAGLWMELVNGRTLEAWLLAHHSMGAGEVASVGVDLCGALAAVHAAGLVHGDVKTQNVMREEGGRIVLMDFGAGRAQGGDAGAFAGTPLYVAPEVLAGEPPTCRSDVYSLGVLLFHLLTGTYPCIADDLDALRAMHADGIRTWLRDRRPDIPASLVETIERALEADPARRFTTAGEMERALKSAEQPVPRRRITPAWLIACAAMLIAAVTSLVAFPAKSPTVGSIAVLPFVSAERGADQHPLLDGLTTDLVREMQRFDVAVKSASAGQPPLDAAQRARFGTDGYVQGELRRSGTRKVVTIAVVRAGGQSLWSHEYDLYDSSVPAVARQIAGDVAHAIGAAQRPGAPSPLQVTTYRAYEAYQRGRVYAEERDEASLNRAIASFKEAASLDPGYAEPWAGMADAYTALGVAAFGGLTPLEARRLAKEAVLNALDRNPELAEAHTSLAFQTYFHDWNWAGADARFKKAISLNPQYSVAHHWYADYLTAMGRYDAAWTEIQRAKELEPLSISIDRDVAWHLFFQRRYADAVTHLEATLRLDAHNASAHTLLARALAELGRYPEALDHLREAAPFMSSPGVNLSFVAYVKAKSGDRVGAEAALAQIQEHASDWHVPPYYAALVYTAEGRTGPALDALETAYREQDPTLVNVRSDPRLESLHGDPRFIALIARMRFPPLP
ncbi:MAG: protein kinase [Acidobacteriota bacterium]